MTPDERRRARQALELALSRPPAERRQSIAEVCGEDTALRQEVESLLTTRLGTPRLAPDGIIGGPDTPAGTPGGTTGAATWADFTLLEQIGHGGFGVVHRAWDRALKREVALKIIHVGRLRAASDDGLLREGQMLARIRHQNVVAVYSAQRIGEEVGLAMEYIKGRTLSNLIALQGPLSAHEAVVIGLAVCDALAAVHRGGLVHRDVKASNVMREAGGRIVLMDFGAGRELLGEPGTWSGLLGTPAYMSPEVLRGERATPVSDVYSLGVLLFHLVTGRYPVSGEGFEEIVRAHRLRTREPLGECRPDLPAAFVAAVERTLAPDADARPQTALALKRELSGAAPPISGSDRRSRRPSRASDAVTPTTERARTLVAASLAPARSGLGVLQIALLSVGGGVLLCAALGFLTTTEFNAVLGRTGAFANDTPLAYVTWGARSLIGPGAFVGVTLLLFNVVLLAARVTGAALPAWRGRAMALRAGMATWLARLELDDLNTIARMLSFGGFVGLVLTLWAFQPLVATFGQRADSVAAESLSILSTNHRDYQSLYRRLLAFDLLVLTVGLVAIVRARGEDRARLSPYAVTGVLAVAGLVLVLLVGPWRLVFASYFREARLGDRRCFVMSEHGTDLLLHCPSANVPRNRVVSRSDPQLAVTDVISNLFDAYGDSRP